MLKVDAISKSFGERRVLRDVSFEVGAGHITGFVGANGAGKTTTMRIMLGVLSADSGQVTLAGSKLAPRDRRIFGYMPEERGLYPKMKLAEQIVYFGRLHGMSPKSAEVSTAQLLDKLELTPRAGDTVESLSLGNQQRAQIAAALVHEPGVLILDEPFPGLDPMGVETVLGVLREAADTGAPVLFSSHQLDVVERLCDDLVIISGGEVRAQGSREELRAQHSHSRWQLASDGDISWIHDVPGIAVIELTGGRAVFEAPDAAAAESVLRRALVHGHVTEFAPQHPTLATIFREVIQ